MMNTPNQRNSSPLRASPPPRLPAMVPGKVPRSQPTPGYGRWTYLLFYAFAVYMVLPLVDVPMLGLSISAPIFFMIAVPVYLRPPTRWFGRYRGWILLALLIWFGIFLAAMLNGIVSSGQRFDRDTILILVQYAYWLLVLVTCAYFIASQNLGSRLSSLLAVSVAVLGLARLAEAIFRGAIGSWSSLALMPQNIYGLLFTTFSPHLLVETMQGKRRFLAGLGLLIVWAAILINGSRSGWLFSLAVIGVTLWMYFLTQNHRIRAGFTLMITILILFMGTRYAPQPVVQAFEARYGTFQSLETDKSYVIRQLMQQKGLRLFKANPLIGVGASRWRKESIPLDIPQILQYAQQSHFDVLSSHNSYISFLAENGLAGAVPFGVLLLVLAIGGYRSATRISHQGRAWPLAFFAGFFGMSLHLWTQAGLSGTITWFVYGTVASLVALAGRSAAKTPLRR